MPKSKTREKKNQEEKVVKSNNPMKTWWGKTIIIILALGFVVSIVFSLVYNLVQLMN